MWFLFLIFFEDLLISCLHLDCRRPREAQEESDNERREQKKRIERPSGRESSKVTLEPAREQPNDSSPRTSADTPTRIEDKAPHGEKSSGVVPNKTENSIISLSRIRNNQESNEASDEKDVLKQRAARFEGSTI